MFSAKSIDEIYGEVKDYDLVLCNDAPLALALKNRLDKPLVGLFAVTPRELTGMLSSDILGCPIIGDIEVVKRVSAATGYKLRFVHGEIENFKRIRRYKSDVKSFLRGRRSKIVFEEYSLLPTLEKAMENFDLKQKHFFDGKKVAVIGLDLFDELDKHVLPEQFDEIDLFNYRDQYRIPEIRELSNDRQIAENVVALIDRDMASDVAIVLNVGDRIADAVRSALYRKRIPFINNLNVRDLSSIRDFLEFVNRSLSFNTVKVGHIRELISSYGGWISSKYDEYLAEQYKEMCENPKAKDLLNVMSGIKNMTYAQVYDSLTKDANETQKNSFMQVKTLLNEMNMNANLVSVSETDDMVYAVNNFNDLKHNEQIPEFEKEGVLLVDCKNSVYIDRPVVFYLGLGTEWDCDLSDLNLVDYRLKDDVIERNTIKFQILLQQGSSRVYAVNSVRNGEKTKPCTMFEHAEDDKFVFEEFSQVCDKVVQGPWYKSEDAERIYAGVDEVDTDYIPKPFSKTSYSNYASCPRGYMFGNLVGTPDMSSTVMGNLIHEYAEFRICFPEIAKEKGLEHYVDAISNECLGLFTPDIRELKKSYIRSALINIDQFVERFGFSSRMKLDRKKEGQKPNRFFEEIGRGQEGSQMTEIRLTSRDAHMEGIFDLLDGCVSYDFKTGSPHSINEVSDAMDLSKKDKFKDFQPLFYLSLLDEQRPGDNEFSLFYAGENSEKMALGNDYDIENNIRRVKLIDGMESYLSERIFDDILNAKKYDFLVPYKEEFIQAVMEVGFDDASAFMDDDVIRTVKAKTGSTAKFEDFEAALKKISKLCEKESFTGGGVLYITKQGIEDFRKTVLDAYNAIAPMFFTDFPAKPTINCDKCHFKDICTEEPLTGGEIDE